MEFVIFCSAFPRIHCTHLFIDSVVEYIIMDFFHMHFFHDLQATIVKT